MTRGFYLTSASAIKLSAKSCAMSSMEAVTDEEEMTEDFSAQNVDVACCLLETTGRYLRRLSPLTATRLARITDTVTEEIMWSMEHDYGAVFEHLHRFLDLGHEISEELKRACEAAKEGQAAGGSNGVGGTVVVYALNRENKRSACSFSFIFVSCMLDLALYGCGDSLKMVVEIKE